MNSNAVLFTYQTLKNTRRTQEKGYELTSLQIIYYFITVYLL